LLDERDLEMQSRLLDRIPLRFPELSNDDLLGGIHRKDAGQQDHGGDDDGHQEQCSQD